jgi:hypothetical protein
MKDGLGSVWQLLDVLYSSIAFTRLEYCTDNYEFRTKLIYRHTAYKQRIRFSQLCTFSLCCRECENYKYFFLIKKHIGCMKLWFQLLIFHNKNLKLWFLSGRVDRRFVPIGKILKPLINECVTPVTCYWSLALLLRDEEELLLVFQVKLTLALPC